MKVLELLKRSKLPLLNKKTFFYIQDQCVGIVPPKVFEHIQRTQPSCFQVNDHVHFHPAFKDVSSRTSALESLLMEWKQQQLFDVLAGWRRERFKVYGQDGPLIEIERAAIGLFGCRSFGCHINGIVGDKMWIARRSYQKPTYPGMLDNLVGGGLSKGTPLECAVKECQEEASIPPAVASQVKNVGAITFWYVSHENEAWTPHTEFVYDLQLGSDFQPIPQDGEVDSFYLWDLPTIRQKILDGEFTMEASLVIIDYLIRHGHLTPENDKYYLDWCETIHQQLGFPCPHYTP